LSAEREQFLSLAADFPPATDEAWRTLVDKVLNGASFDKTLVNRTYDGIAIQPLYTRADWKADGDPSGFPGGAPYTRGSSVLGTAQGGWDVRQRHAHPDPEAVNRQILEDLERGATSIALRIDPLGQSGTCIRSRADLATALRGVLLDLAPIVLEPVGQPMPVIAALADMLREAKTDAFAGNFGFDPIGIAAATGLLTANPEVALARCADTAAYVAERFPKTRAINLSTVPYSSAGCAEAQELGLAMATAAEYLRALTKIGLDIDAACGQIAFTVTADADMMLSIGKIRALRRLWARVAEACGAERRVAPVTAVTAPRMYARRDPWVNILRGTIACFAAAVAGADAITVLPFDVALGQPSALGRRIARNTQVVLEQESGLAKVIDPAGGAWTLEKLTDELAQTAWAFFQKIETAGGMTAALVSGGVAKEIAAVRDARLANIAKRKDPLTGLSEFPNLHEARVETETVDIAAVLNKRDQGPVGTIGSLPAPGKGVLTRTMADAVKDGANLLALAQALNTEPLAKAEALPQIRLGQEFERWRDAGDAFKAKFGDYPKVFLACIGTLADFTPRASFAKNFFEAGGFATVLGATDTKAVAVDFKRSQAAFAVICGPDRLYEEQAAPFARALREAGAALIYLAGRGGAKEADYRAAGVDGFIFIGCNVPDVLSKFHQRLAA
jgi:methylmalonyl-CoA mutase